MRVDARTPAAQDAFCANTVCVIQRIYDQSGGGNDLQQAGPGTFKGPTKGGFDAQPIADMAPITIMGHPTRNFPVQVQSQLSVPSYTSACRPFLSVRCSWAGVCSAIIEAVP